jgi:Xaa-Pro aminopeptidase
MGKIAILQYADSEHCADQLYACGLFVPDPFISIQVEGRLYAVVNMLEFGRFIRSPRFEAVYSWEKLIEETGERTGGYATVAGLVKHLSGKLSVDVFRVAETFPAALLRLLQERGVAVEIVSGALFPEREIKTDRECKCIREGNAAAATGFAAVERILSESSIQGDRLFFDGKILTAERVREAIAVACIGKGAWSLHTIVACGDQACDPHNAGSGPIRPHELIIVDIFPRVEKTGYFGDMTRTYLKGIASSAQKKLVKTVFKAQRMALKGVRSGRIASELYGEVIAYFDAQGYPLRSGRNGAEGFIHGLGHGLGLEIHEAPRVSRAHNLLQSGQVITIEPGLYFRGLGGCRIEDVVQVTATGCRILSRHPYRWQIA